MNTNLLMYKDILKIIEKSSTCSRLHVAAMIVKDGRIISMGWNGVASGQVHCSDKFSGKEENYDVKHVKFSTENEIHAEQNAIAYAARSGISTHNADIFVSYSPCDMCAKLIVAAGIKKVYYITEYDRSVTGINFLKNNNIYCEKI